MRIKGRKSRDKEFFVSRQVVIVEWRLLEGAQSLGDKKCI